MTLVTLNGEQCWSVAIGGVPGVSSESANQEATALDVTVMGREFRVACSDEERGDLIRAVEYLDRRMTDIRDAGKVVGTEKIAIMAALNIAHELLRLKVGSGVDLGELRRRIRACERSMEIVMNPHDKLL